MSRVGYVLLSLLVLLDLLTIGWIVYLASNSPLTFETAMISVYVILALVAAQLIALAMLRKKRPNWSAGLAAHGVLSVLVLFASEFGLFYF